MHEQYPNRPLRTRHTGLAVAALIIASSGLAGCQQTDTASIRGLPRCYEQPQSPLYMADQPSVSEFEIYKSRSGTVQEDPGRPNPATLSALAGASIKIRNIRDGKHVHGSGFITTNPAGERIAVTAAHVAATADIRTLNIYSQGSGPTGVVSGCIMHEANGKHTDPYRPDGTATIDIAVLRLQRPVGKGALQLADMPPHRGSWEPVFYNFAYNRPLDNPAVYSGVVAGYTSATTTAILTGIQSQRNCEPTYSSGISDCAVQSGASGSPVAYRSNAQVFGMVIASSTDAGMAHLSPPNLRQRLGIQFNSPAGAGTGNWPVAAITVDAEQIRRATASTAY